MDNQRVILWAVLLFVYYLLYQAWVTDYRPPEPAPQAPAATAQPDDVVPDLPELPSQEPASGLPPATEDVPLPEDFDAGRIVRVKTDVLDLDIDTRGGNLRQVRLPAYPVRKDQPDVPITLLDPSPARIFAVRSGLRAAGGAPEPNHKAQYRAAASEYLLRDQSDDLEVVLRWDSGEGIAATKTYRFQRGSYAIGVEYRLENRGETAWRGTQYMQIRRRALAPDRSLFDVDSYSFTGAVFYNGEKYQKLDIDELQEEPLQQTLSGGWIASIQHHFLVAAIPAAEQTHDFRGLVREGASLLTAIGPLEQVAPGASTTFSHTVFAGPKLQKQLTEAAAGLKLTVDYGWLTIISQPLFWLLSKINAVVGNWGWSIIIVTLLIKLLFYKLSETSGHSMAKMRKLQPRIKHLQERFKDDRQALSAAMMELYKKEKVNPAAGCLPILVQMPVFLAFYWVLLESVEMRQAPFMLWISDLSSRDPFFILPLLMGAAMFGQQKLNPPPPDPVQAKIFMFMPVMFTVFFAFFPAGLVLYWFTNTLLSIAQQWRINKVVEAAQT